MSSNDNRASTGIQWALYGLPGKPNDCPCGNDCAFVDSRNVNGRRGPFFVWCSDCGRTGPERPTYNDALAVWNRATETQDLSLIHVVDNAST